MFAQVNDLLRDAFTNKDKLSGQDKIFFPLEVLAGCGAGASQVVFTVSNSSILQSTCTNARSLLDYIAVRSQRLLSVRACVHAYARLTLVFTLCEQ
jgi:hypothetical protein